MLTNLLGSEAVFGQQVIMTSIAMHEFVAQRENIELANRSTLPC
jgi:hypothetical protein